VATHPESRARIFAWRKGERERLIAERLAIDGVDRRQRAIEISRHLMRLIEPLYERTVSFYWPFRGEQKRESGPARPLPHKDEISAA
jgi:5-formyltetrahydrofolate cyclo-ligase